MYSVVDLFAGAGGLSLGFRQTGKFDVKVAFEINPQAQKTYRRNHTSTKIFEDVCGADYAAITQEFGDVDIVIGGPPCQGFSNANRQKNHAISKNNILLKQYIRAIIELQPKAFLLENVGMLKSSIHRFYMDEEDEGIVKQYQIPTEKSELVLLEARYASERMLEIVQHKSQINQYLWDEADYLLLNVVFKQRNNKGKLVGTLTKYAGKLVALSVKFLDTIDMEDEICAMNGMISNIITNYYQGECVADTLTAVFEKPIMIQRMLSKAKEIFDHRILVKEYTAEGSVIAHTLSFAVYDYLKCILGSDTNSYALSSDILCAADFGAPQRRMRFVVMGIKRSIVQSVDLPKGHIPEDKYFTVEDAIADLADINPHHDVSADIGVLLNDIPDKPNVLCEKLRDSATLYNHIVPESSIVALRRFAVIKQGENFHSLDVSMKEDTYTDASRTQNTIYLRLNYKTPSGTVLNVRKSMWIHPVHNRAISIREAARLQTFPDSFIFEGPKDAQYQQVGNAVPPCLAKALANSLANSLDEGLSKKQND